MASQRLLKGVWKNRDSILLTLAITHNDLVAFEVNIFDAQSQALQYAQATPVQQTRHQPARAVELRQDPLCFFAGKHDGNVS